MTKYHITYHLEHHPDGLERCDIDPNKVGACDNIVMLSIMGTPGEAETLSVAAVSLAGKTGERMTRRQEWVAWTVWTASLANAKDLSEVPRALCRHVADILREALRPTK